VPPTYASPLPDVTVWMPCAPGEQPRPAPPLLTALECCQMLRLDTGVKNPLRTLEHYRARGLLTGIRVGRGYVYPLSSVWRFVQLKLKES
jgi:hypothetical protein